MATGAIASRYVIQLLPHLKAAPVQIHSRFDRSLNLLVGPRLLLTIQVPSLGHSPFGLVVPEAAWPALRQRLSTARVGELTMEGYGVALGGSPLLTVGGHSHYEPALAIDALSPLGVEAREFHRALLQLSSQQQGDPAQPGLAALLAHWRPGFTVATDQPHEAWLVAAAPAVADFAGGDPDRLIGAARRLIGLGPGLTPSGDDFLVGFLGALRLRRATHLLRRLRRNLLPYVWHGTNLISAQYLRHAMLGRFSSPLKGLLEAIGKEGGQPHLLRPAIERVTTVGSTSGWDSLVGVLAGLYWHED